MTRTSDPFPDTPGVAAVTSTLAAAGRSMVDILRESVGSYAARPAMDFLGRRWTYGELGQAVERTAAGLQVLGVAPGDRVGLCLPNTPYSVIAYFAVLRIGAIVVNYNPLYVERELESQIKDSGTSVMFVIDLPQIHAKVAAVAERAGLRKIVLCSLADALPGVKGLLYKALKRKERVACPADGRHLTFATLVATREPVRPVAVAADDVAVLQYTGGTTGTPKGAMLTHGNIVANALQNVAHDKATRPGEERVLCVLPLFHVYAMTVVMNQAIAVAAEIVLLPRYDLATTMKTMIRCKPTVFPAVPTLYLAIAQAARTKKADLSFVRTCISGGAPLPVETAKQFVAVTGARLVEGYGLTESSPSVCCNPVDGSPVKIGSVGRALQDTVIEIRDPASGALCATGDKGEIVVRGPQVMRGYWNRPEETALTLREHGLHTGDIGYLDEDNYLFIVDRIKDLILCGGYNVYPRTIEEALYQHDEVAEAIVIGVPDAYRGEAPKAFVVLREGASATPDTLRSFLDGYLSKIERPRDIEIRTSLPKTAVGKLSRKELVAEEQAHASPGA